MDRSLGVAKAYNNVARKYVKVFFDDFSDKKELDRLVSCIPPHGKILDAGCGPGNFAKYFIERGFDVTGIDISKNMIKEARILVPTGKFTVMNLRKLNFTSKSFDGILAAYPFVHLSGEDAEKALAECHRVLKPKGFLLFLVKEGKGERVERSKLNSSVKIHIKLWEMSEAIKMLKEGGFTIVSKRKSKPKTKKELQHNKICLLAQKI